MSSPGAATKMRNDNQSQWDDELEQIALSILETNFRNIKGKTLIELLGHGRSFLAKTEKDVSSYSIKDPPYLFRDQIKRKLRTRYDLEKDFPLVCEILRQLAHRDDAPDLSEFDETWGYSAEVGKNMWIPVQNYHLSQWRELTVKVAELILIFITEHKLRQFILTMLNELKSFGSYAYPHASFWDFPHIQAHNFDLDDYVELYSAKESPYTQFTVTFRHHYKDHTFNLFFDGAIDHSTNAITMDFQVKDLDFVVAFSWQEKRPIPELHEKLVRMKARQNTINNQNV